MPTLITLLYSLLLAQTVRFEEASFKLAPPRTGEAAQPKLSLTPGRVAFSNVGLKFLVGSAYRISDARISGGEGWIGSVRYDVNAIYPPETPRNQINEMVKALLIERIGLVAHVVQKETATYALVVDKRGAKLRPAERDAHGEGYGTDGHITGKVGMAGLASMISRYLGRPVTDMTQVQGRYDVELKWAPDTARGSALPDAGPSIFTALTEQLGLQLRSRKEMLDYLVIDRALREPIEP